MNLAQKENLEVNVDLVLRSIENLAENQNIKMIDFKNISSIKADAMKEEKSIEMPIQNNISINDIALYPNPNNGIFNLNFDAQTAGDIEVKVYGSDGRLVFNESKTNFSGKFLGGINLEDKSQGVYFLTVQQNGKTYSKKFIVR